LGSVIRAYNPRRQSTFAHYLPQSNDDTTPRHSLTYSSSAPRRSCDSHIPLFVDTNTEHTAFDPLKPTGRPAISPHPKSDRMGHLDPSTASGSRTPRPKTLTPSPPRSRAISMTRTMEPDAMVLLRTIDFAARVRFLLLLLLLGEK
jgi:hypothetical protein